ncbi:glutaredoxin [Fusarium subglutinans]|uniref:Glutaredoxin n=1 Tax=Gibberella subglutinans TaxID=42677 RepID=A0A8H5KR82_GIBSU|nr:glutaredoxin [Fusarium subglutinans]KAF5578472.1 glutaredoxin [Fusarium subglutinans]
MLSFKTSFFLAFFLWAFTLEAAPAMHHHRHGNQHLRHLHATRAALLHRARSHYHHGAPQVLSEEPQKPSSNLENLCVPGRSTLVSRSSSFPFPFPFSHRHLRLNTPADRYFSHCPSRLFRRSLIIAIRDDPAAPSSTPIARRRDAQELLTRARSLAHPPTPGPEIIIPPTDMPSPRRVRLLILATIGTFIFILFYTSGFDSHHDAETYTGQEFIKKTQNAMSANEPPAPIVDFATGEKAGQPHADKDGDGDVDADDQKLAAQMQERLKAAEAEAKGKANEKGGLRPDPPKKVVGVGSSAEGQDKDKIVKPVGGESGDIPAPAAAAEKKPETETRSKEAIAAREELDSILKKSPVIIFSKTYCPYSKRAKGLLIGKYSIKPEPYVVELDIHPQGQALQDQLRETTGRRTVPNIMVNGVSLGGADDITEMDQAGQLVGKIVDLGNKRVEVLERTK